MGSLIGQVAEISIQTIAKLSPEGKFHPIQKAFLEAGAIQCGYCTPGAVLVVKTLLEYNPHPSEQAIRKDLSGNPYCCTYTRFY